MSGELFPIVSGLAIGAVVGLIRPTVRVWIGVLLAIILFGVAATVLSGEFEVSWAFLLVDIPLVAVSAVAGLLLMRRLRLGSWVVR